MTSAAGIDVTHIRVQRKQAWAVWNKEDGFSPQFHGKRPIALAAAARLAQDNPTKKFHVVYFDVKVSFAGVESHTEAHAHLAHSGNTL